MLLRPGLQLDAVLPMALALALPAFDLFCREALPPLSTSAGNVAAAVVGVTAALVAKSRLHGMADQSMGALVGRVRAAEQRQLWLLDRMQARSASPGNAKRCAPLHRPSSARRKAPPWAHRTIAAASLKMAGWGPCDLAMICTCRRVLGGCAGF